MFLPGGIPATSPTTVDIPPRPNTWLITDMAAKTDQAFPSGRISGSATRANQRRAFFSWSESAPVDQPLQTAFLVPAEIQERREEQPNSTSLHFSPTDWTEQRHFYSIQHLLVVYKLSEGGVAGRPSG